MSAVTVAYNGIKLAKDVFSVLLSLKIDAEVLAKVTAALNELGKAQDTLFELREQLFELQSKNDELKRALSAHDDWENQIAAYGLSTTAGGAVVYASKGQPQHYACPSCITKRQIHLLQDLRVSSGKFQCPSCQYSFPIKPARPKPVMDADSF